MNPRVFKGARDFLPEQMLHRERITSVMRSVFKKYGFAPLETPAIEYLDTLTGKYGEDADRLIYRLDYKIGSKDAAALHYDLTVPFSRVMAMNPHFAIPFKRYQIQPVWRADRPQPHQGRFREFTQCDCDVMGTKSMVVDAELIAITYEVLKVLGFENFLIKINNRKILNGLTQYAGLTAEFTSEICRSIDKLDKAPWEEVEKELEEKNIPKTAIEKIKALLLGKNLSIENLRIAFANIPLALEGLDELTEIFKLLEIFEIDSKNYTFDLSLARGLDYYTGPIFETKLPLHPHIGSLTGGGRYDELIGLISGKEMPAAGISLGLDRIYTAMEQLNMLSDIKTSTKVLIANFSSETYVPSLQLLHQLRAIGIPTEFFPEQAKMKKQFSYADKLSIPYVLILGEEELKMGKISLKEMKSGDQILIEINDIEKEISK